ncbi:unnamed protein product [Cochlearia groenlandica]
MVRSKKQQETRVASSSTYIRSIHVKQQQHTSPKMTTTTTTADNKTQTQTHKKQVRRRLHTSRPYQERLLNMAEARREIVTALKQHRASMRQASNKIPPPPPLNTFSPPLPPPPPDPFPHLSFVLPNQPLGLNLNLNFQDFNDFIQTSSSSSSSVSASSSSSSHHHIYSSPSPPPPFSHATFAATSDTVPLMVESDNNVVTSSSWWSEIMMKPDIVKPEEEEAAVVEDDVFPKFNDVMEYPSWLNPTEEEEIFHPYDLNYYSSPHNPPLSCMEIGEIEGMDGDDWFA